MPITALLRTTQILRPYTNVKFESDNKRCSYSRDSLWTQAGCLSGLMDSVLDFAVSNHRETWQRGDPQYESLGDVIAAVAQQRGWAGRNSFGNRDAAVKMTPPDDIAITSSPTSSKS